MPYPYYQGYPAYSQMYLPQMQSVQQPQQNNQQSIQNGGFVMVKSVQEAMSYPVAPGNSVTFKNENQPYIYTKTLGFSQLDQPIFEVFKLVKEDNMMNSGVQTEIIAESVPAIEYLSLEDAEQLKADITRLNEEMIILKSLIEEQNKEVVSA